jgi:hypothetical protein
MNKQSFNIAFEKLTKRRREVLLKLLANEKSEAIAKSLHIEESTVRKHIQEICEGFGLRNEFPDQRRSKLPELITLFAKYKPELLNIHNSEQLQTEDLDAPKPIYHYIDFLGREEDIANINNLVNEGKKVILIKAEGGIGKTTLAENWFKIQGLDYLKLNVGTTSQTLKSVEEWVISQLKQTFKITPAQNFGNMLDQLITQLQKQKIGILIDNLEPALKNGEFIEPHQNYVDLLEALADQNLQSITIITSREQIYEHKIFRLPTFYNYDLEGLNEKIWQEYFENKEIIIDNDSLNAIWRNYGGNAEAMSLLAADILNESKGDLKAYWQDNSEDLLRHRSLEQLVKSQFDKLRNDNLQAYNLLCRLGVYPNQDVNLPEIWLFCLLWDAPQNRQKRVINDLLSRCLIKKRDECYYLHPILRIQAIYEFNLLVQNHNINILILKSKIDDIILNNQKIQSFLNSINQKLFFVSECYKKSAFRAVHLEHLLTVDYEFDKSINNQDNNQYYELSSRIDKSFNILFKGVDFVSKNFCEQIERYCANKFMDYIDKTMPNISMKIKNIKYHPQLLNSVIQDIYPLLPNFIDEHILDVYENYIEMLSFLKTNVLNDQICNLHFEIFISSLSFEQINNLIENKGFDEIKFICLDMGNSIISKVTFTLDEFKDLIIGDLSQYQENSNICISGIRSHKSEVKSSKLSESLIFYENRNLQEEWKLTYKDINMLRDYYDANLLITYSLYLTSPEVRSYIEETLLLPIEEIEKHPFKYQE